MFFKRLEIFGFKSFAEKTTLDFEAGVTAIVGPNGCGKSNISDSIKWVLGEQSVRSMRGSKMEDVIFHGADDISPVGFAEVSLTISNQNNLLPLDYEEITITRRIFRSGESEYLINKIPVRLKDISELLMDTGLGVSSYSLMEQGKVDQILNSRPEERRFLFEEASGITKYKAKKEEALRKLERTSENLQRIGDIIVEVKRQIKSMERQVHKARRYKEEFQRLKEFELKVAQHQYRHCAKEKEQLENQFNIIEKEEQHLAAQMQTTAYALEKTRNELALIEENISQIRSDSYEVMATIKTAENRVALDVERIEELTKRGEDLKLQIESLGKKLCTILEQIKQTQERIETIKQEKQQKLSLVSQKEKEIQDVLECIKDVQQDISEKKAQELEVIAQTSRKKNDLTKLEANLANLNARLRRLNMESESTKAELNNSQERFRNSAMALELLSAELKALTKEIWDLRSNLDIELDKKKQLESCQEDIAHRITAVQSKLAFLKEITQKHEGFGSGVKAILSALEAGKLNAIGSGYALVADLVKVAPEYQRAIETALGENAQAVVVENSQQAAEAIDYLKNESAGRARFICLDSLPLEIKPPAPEAAIGLAEEFAQVQPQYQKALEYLLADTFIVKDMTVALQIIQAHAQDQIRLVTLQGELLTRTTIIAGSLPKDSDISLLGRRERIVQAQAELEKAQQEKREIEDLKAIKDHDAEKIAQLIHEKEPGLDQLKVDKSAKENELTNIEAEKKRFTDELALLALEIEETSEQLQQLQDERESLNQDFTQLQQQQAQLECEIKNQESLIADKNQARQNAIVEIAQANAASGALDKEAQDTQARLELIIESEVEQRDSLQAREQEARDNQDKVAQLKLEVEQFKAQALALSQNKVDLEEKLNQALQKRQNLYTNIQELENRSRANQRNLDQARESRSSFQVKISEVGYKRDSLKDRMQQNYQVDLESILEGVVELPPVEDSVYEEINQLRTRLEGMGPVNLVAIEENDQLQQRYDFLVSQQEDLVNAQASLRKAISQINHTARETFTQTFQKIQVLFKDYFRLLFNGGDARLILIDENNILESGIEIVVRPPGKKLQNISLLSGGEKAMTAIALLFAIFKVRPSPFCILDEVDAPLDEANVTRFTGLLSEFLQSSQFILITHNKKTINMADVMYGITMERSGVSKIVSVKFAEQNQAAVAEVAPVEG